MGIATNSPSDFKALYTQYTDSVFHIKKPKNAVQKTLRPFRLSSDCIIFSKATNKGTIPINKIKVVLFAGGQANHKRSPDIIESRIFFFIKLIGAGK